MSTPRSPSTKRTFVMLLFAVGVAAGGYFAVAAATNALGYGSDTHAFRALAVCAFLFVNALLVLWPGMWRSVRVLGCVMGLGLALTAWVYTPSRPGGMSLAGALSAQQAAESEADIVPFGDSKKLWELKNKTRALETDFPELSLGLRARLEQRADDAATAIMTRFQQLSPDDLTTALELRAEAEKLKAAQAWARTTPMDEVRAWAMRAATAKAEELRGITAFDLVGFERTGVSRHTMISAFPQADTELRSAEARWMEKSANFMVVAYTHADVTLKDIREGCRDTEKKLLALRTLDESPARFRAARSALFHAAHEAARTEVYTHIDAERYGVAFKVAVTHGLDWFATATLLGPADVRTLDQLRESSRFLAVLDEKASNAPETAPLPRTKP